MKILLIYPRCPETFWSFKYALKFISKKAGGPPLGLLTVASILPSHWEKRLVDMNVSPLADNDIQWADYVFIGAMSIQYESAKSVLNRCKVLGIKTVAGGPLFSTRYSEFTDVDHFVLNEAEITLPLWLEDLAKGEAKPLYTTDKWSDMALTPIPSWNLINFKHYASMCLQYSRGCPHDCSFCDITVLYGRNPRTKSKEQIIAELDSLYNSGWRGPVFFVDDNFIGNKKEIKQSVLPAIIDWMDAHKHPFVFNTECTITLADDEELMNMMARAGFITVFVGIESPNEESLAECGKHTNTNRDLLASVRKIQNHGIEIQGGFIVGFDSDPISIFDKVTNFIQASGIATAMVGLLNAPNGTKLYNALNEENRIIKSMSGDNTDWSMNFKPKMNYGILLQGYADILSRIYAPKHYYARVQNFLTEYKPIKKQSHLITRYDIYAFFKSIFVLGVVGKERVEYWKLFFWSIFRHPRLFPQTITLAIYGFHFRKVMEHYISLI